MSYLQFGRRKAKRKSLRARTFESLEPRSMLASQSAVFDFEELPATSLPRNGAHTELVQTDGQMRMTITRPGSRFDIVDNSGDQEKPFPFRERSLDPFYDQSAKPFVVNFSIPVRSVEVIFGDFGEDERDVFIMQAFSKRDGGGTMLGSNHKTLPAVEGNEWEWSVVRVEREGIHSIKMAGGTSSFPSSTFIDNIRVVYETIEHDVGKTKTTLRTKLAMKVTQSLGGDVTRTAFEIRQLGANQSSWEQAASKPGAAKTVYFQPKLAGRFEVRAMVRVGDAVYRSEATPLEVVFPTAAQIQRDLAINLEMDQAWKETKSFTASDPNHRRREIGFYIRYSSASGKYTVYKKVRGDIVSGSTVPTLELGPPPADKIKSTSEKENSPLATGIYTVAVFHTHTPRAYISSPRPAGPSMPDERTAASLLYVHFVYDYVGVFKNGEWTVPGKWPLDKPAQIKPFGVLRRPTP